MTNQHKVRYFPIVASAMMTMAEAYELLQAKREGAVYIYVNINIKYLV